MRTIGYKDFLVASWLPEVILKERKIARTSNGNTMLLAEGNQLWMSDIPKEIDTTRRFLEAAKGKILILGLGIGMVPAWLSKHEDVESIDIVEINQEVIDYVGEHLVNNFPKITIYKGDALTWNPGDRHWDCALQDFWPDAPDEKQLPIIVEKYKPFVTTQYFWTGDIENQPVIEA